MEAGNVAEVATSLPAGKARAADNDMIWTAAVPTMTTIEIYDPSHTFLEISALDLPISAPYFYLRRSYVVVICTRIGTKPIGPSEVLFSLPMLPQVFRTCFHSL